MNLYLAIAAVLSALGGVLHSVLGERLILSKLEIRKLPELLGSSEFLHRVLRLFWHLVTVAWWGLTVLLLLLASMPPADATQPLVLTIAITFLISAALSLILSRGRPFSWAVLLWIAVLAWLGAG